MRQEITVSGWASSVRRREASRINRLSSVDFRSVGGSCCSPAAAVTTTLNVVPSTCPVGGSLRCSTIFLRLTIRLPKFCAWMFPAPPMTGSPISTPRRNFRPNLRIDSSNPIAGPFEKSFHLPVELPLFSGRPISPPAIQACCRDMRRLARMANIRSAAELSWQWGRGYDYTRTRPRFGRAGCSLVQKCKWGPNDFCRNRNLGPLLGLHDRDEATGKKSQNAPRGHPPRKLPGKSTPVNPRRPPRSHVYDPIVLIHGH